MEKNSIDIKEVSGDIIGVGIDGSGNIIGKDISIVINQAQSYGINLLQIILKNIRVQIRI